MSVKDAVDALAQRAVAIAHGASRQSPQELEKTALLGDVGKWFGSLDPMQRNAMIGAGLGAGVGLGSSMFKDEDERQPFRSAVTGALAGGAVGLGAGAISRFAPQDGPTKDSKGRPKLPDNQFYHPDTGKPMQFKPDVTPEIATKYKDLDSAQSMPSLPQKATEYGAKGLWGTITGAPATIAAGLGIGGYTLNRMGGPKGINPTQYKNPDALQSGMEALMGEKKPGQVLGKEQAGRVRDFRQQAAADPSLYQNLRTSQPGQYGPSQAMAAHGLSDATIGLARERGAIGEVPEILRKAGTKPLIRESLLHRLTGHGDPHVNMSGKGGMLRTALGYGVPLAAGLLGERSLRDWMSQRSDASQMRDILEQYAQPVE